MIKNCRNKTACAFLTFFLLGGVSGWFLCQNFSPAKDFSRVLPEQLETTIMEKAEEHLNLNRDQVEKIRPVVSASAKRYAIIQHELVSRNEESFIRMVDDMLKGMKPFLTSQQIAIMEVSWAKKKKVMTSRDEN